MTNKAKAEEIRRKKDLASEIMCIPASKDLTKIERFGWKRKRELLTEIKRQISICEDLMTPLDVDDIKKLCAMQTETEIQNYCRRNKIA